MAEAVTVIEGLVPGGRRVKGAEGPCPIALRCSAFGDCMHGKHTSSFLHELRPPCVHT